MNDSKNDKFIKLIMFDFTDLHWNMNKENK